MLAIFYLGWKDFPAMGLISGKAAVFCIEYQPLYQLASSWDIEMHNKNNNFLNHNKPNNCLYNLGLLKTVRRPSIVK
jgi:hypothetical protein